MYSKSLIATTLVLLFAAPSTASACTIHVPADYPTIQQAIDAAIAGDVICVAPGSYSEALDLQGKAIILRSIGGAAMTIVDATGLMDSAISCRTGEGPDSIIEGFTFTGGQGRLPTAGTTTERLGGGMFNEGSSPTVRHCIFESNPVETRGGGMANLGASPVVTNCIFRHHSTASDGGAIYNTSLDNAASDGSDNSRPIFVNCHFYDNDIGLLGGLSNQGAAVRDDLMTQARYVNCVFRDNSAVAGVSAFGGALAAFGSSTSSLYNCTIVNNVTDNGAGAVYANSSTVNLINCVIWGNTDSQFDGPGTINASYCSLQAAHTGAGNIVGDPLVKCASSGNLRLGPASPCIDSGDSTALTAAMTGLAADIVTDLDGNGRFADMAGVTDTGIPIGFVGGTVDMGAYETQFDNRPADINGDGLVNVTDLLALLAAWGGCP